MPDQVNLHSSFNKSVRNGKSKIIVNWKADDLIFDLAKRDVALMVAAELKAGIIEEIKAIPITVKPETVAKRESDLRNWSKGSPAPSLKAKYSGGRMGPMAPVVSDKFGQNSGRFLKGIVINPRINFAGEPVVTMNVAINRLDPTTFGGGQEGLEERFIRPLQQYVSFFGSDIKATTNARLSGVLTKVSNLLVATNKTKAAENRMEFAKTTLEIVKQALEVLDVLAE